MPEPKRVADPEALKHAFSVATTSESAIYLREQFSNHVKKLGLLDTYKEVIAEMDKFAAVIQDQMSMRSNYWSGDLVDKPLTKFRSFQENQSNQAVESLRASIPKGEVIQFDFAMDDESHLLQGYSIAGKPLDSDFIEKLDLIYSDWLTRYEMICQDGIIFESGEEGGIKQKNGQDVRVNAHDYIEQFTSEKPDGFKAFAEDKALEVDVRHQPYPSQEPAKSQTSSD